MVIKSPSAVFLLFAYLSPLVKLRKLILLRCCIFNDFRIVCLTRFENRDRYTNYIPFMIFVFALVPSNM